MSAAIVAMLAASGLAATATQPAPAGAVPGVPTAGGLPEGWSQVSRQTFRAIQLRGYGQIAAEAVVARTGAGDYAVAVQIDCESADKARVVHAKHQSDLSLLGGVQAVTVKAAGGADIPALRLDRGPTYASARCGTQVLLLAAEKTDDLPRLAAACGLLRDAGAGDAGAAEFKPTAAVPLLLDAWDKHGFRFYYRPWEKPVDPVQRKDYDPMGEFDFCARNGGLGLVFWAEPHLLDSAEGMNNDAWWDWAARAATRRNLPLVINTSAGGPFWIANRYRDQLMQKMPQYCGAYHAIAEPYFSGEASLSWCSTTAKDAQLAQLQRIVRRFAGQPNTIDFLEPHGELRHGNFDVLLEYGPVADRSFREYLRLTYPDPAAVGKRWGRTLASWDDVHVPEVASFCGWGPEAMDLAGTWRIQYEPFRTGVQPPKAEQLASVGENVVATEPAPAEWFQPAMDDAAWPQVIAPGHDRTMFLPKRPAVYRRHFPLPPEWLAGKDRVWLYVWDLSLGSQDQVLAHLNGRRIGQSTVHHNTPHWDAYEATGQLRAGDNLLALRLPKGILAYRVYLSQHPPRQYPDLPEGLCAQWVDFARWYRWSRLEMCRRGLEMIRSSAPDAGIVCMAPEGFLSGVKRLCEDYGGRFHNTGYMGAWWAELLPMLMRGSDLPVSLEPGGPAGNLTQFKTMMGLYHTEGIQAVHYFIHVGDVLWNDAIRGHFEKTKPLIDMIGKVHPPKAETALLLSDQVDVLTGYPWGRDPNTALPSGYFNWKLNEFLLDAYPMDAVTDMDFGSAGGGAGAAAAYRVIVDTNTSVMDDALVDRIESWVRAGGTFVTFVQTGRHSPTRKDAWPISRLTGYAVTAVDAHKPDGAAAVRRTFRLAEGQTVLPAEWGTGNWNGGNGLSLRKVAPECQDVLVWQDGSVAMGVRPLGKGRVVHLGVKFAADRIWRDGTDKTRRLFRDLLAWCKVTPVAGRAEKVLLRHYVSNNGLYDAWVLWNRGDKAAVETSLELAGKPPAWCRDVLTGSPVDVVETGTGAAAGGGGAAVRGLRLEPLEVRYYLTPRASAQAVQAPIDWLTLQRNWWRGTRPAGLPPPPPLPEVQPRNALDLTADWAWHAVADKAEADKFAAPAADDAAWPRRNLDVWAVPEEIPSRHLLFRKRFTVPAEWKGGETRFWLASWFAYTHEGTMRIWLDGKLLCEAGNDGVCGRPVGDLLPAGGQHALAVEIDGRGPLCGPRGSTWLSFIPTPAATVDLAGQWQPSKDGLRYDAPTALPGAWDAYMARRTVTVDKAHEGKQVYLRVRADGGIVGAIVNGTWVRRHHHIRGDLTFLNITPMIRLGSPNEIELVRWSGPGRCTIHEVRLDLYDAERAP